MSNLSGYEAITYAEANGLTLNKYNDPTEDAREGLTVDEARKIALEDPGLIYIEAVEETCTGVPTYLAEWLTDNHMVCSPQHVALATEVFDAASEDGTIQAEQMVALFPASRHLHCTTSLRRAMELAGCEEAR